MHILDKHLNKLYGKDRGSMAHLQPGRRVGAPWAAVTVEVKSKGKDRWLEIVPGEVCVLKSDALVMELPVDIPVRAPDEDEPIRPARGVFLISTETFDPYHLVCDGWPDPQKSPMK